MKLEFQQRIRLSHEIVIDTVGGKNVGSMKMQLHGFEFS